MPPTPFVRFIAPSIQPHAIVKEILSALDDQESRVVRLPTYTQIARITNVGANLVPAWFRDFLQWVCPPQSND